MAEERHPVSGQPMDVGPWERLVSTLATSGVVGNPGGPELQAYRTAAGLFVRPGLGMARGHSFFRPAADGDRQLTVVQNAGGSARLDLVTLRLDPLASPIIDLKVITGGATAPVPTRTPTGIFDVALGIASTPSGSNVPSSVQDIRDFSGIDAIPCGTVAEITSDRPRRFGTIAPESSTGKIKWWNGTQWVEFSMSTHTHTEFSDYSPHRGWMWAGALNAAYTWYIPSGNWNIAPNSAMTVSVKAGHLYQFRSNFTVSQRGDQANYNCNWRSGLFVNDQLLGECFGVCSSAVPNYSGAHIYPTNQTQMWRASTTGNVTLSTRFAAAAVNMLHVYNPFSSPYTEFTDLGPRTLL